MCASELEWGGTHALDDHKKADQFSFTCAQRLSCQVLAFKNSSVPGKGLRCRETIAPTRQLK